MDKDKQPPETLFLKTLIDTIIWFGCLKTFFNECKKHASAFLNRKEMCQLGVVGLHSSMTVTYMYNNNNGFRSSVLFKMMVINILMKLSHCLALSVAAYKTKYFTSFNL